MATAGGISIFKKLERIELTSLLGVRGARSFVFKACLLPITLSFLMLALFSPAGEAAKLGAELTGLLDRRSVACWPEGEVFGDMVIGARGKLTFVYVDSKLGRALRKMQTSGTEGSEEENIPRVLVGFSGKFSERSGHKLFVLYIDSYKPWEFGTGKIRVGDYVLDGDDMISGMFQNQDAELPPGEVELPGGYSGITSFYVKNEFLKPGNEIKIGYGEDLTLWKIPAKNE